MIKNNLKFKIGHRLRSHLDDASSEILELEPSPEQSQPLDRKRRETEGEKSLFKKRKSDVGHFLIQNFDTMSYNVMLVDRNVGLRVANAFLSGLELIQLISRLKMSNNAFSPKMSRC